jgi:hypothetical protein
MKEVQRQLDLHFNKDKNYGDEGFYFIKSLVIFLSILLFSVSFSGCESAKEEAMKEKQAVSEIYHNAEQRSYITESAEQERRDAQKRDLEEKGVTQND